MNARSISRIRSREFVVGIIGMGYVGLPLAIAFCTKGFKVIGFDVDSQKTVALNKGQSYIKHIRNDSIVAMQGAGLLEATADFDRLAEADALLICVPTPITRHLEPDLRYVVETAESIGRCLKSGQIVILESTTYPGTTMEVIKPILEQSGLRAGIDFFLAYSPEREDPGNIDFSTSRIPKVVGADDTQSRAIALALYDAIVPQTVPVSSMATAEAVKITENVFRAVNIALVNELKVVYEAMGINVWEVIEAAKTKPFGFMPFYPGPGLGGHCIPIDPFYLTWKAREYNQHTRFIELAGQINADMPEHVVRVLADTLDARLCKGLNGARVLVIGLAYKKNVDDTRESPALRLIDILESRNCSTDYYDPHVPEIPKVREYPALAGRKSIGWDLDRIASYDAVLIATDHDGIDFSALAGVANLVIDTRNACARAGADLTRVVRA